MMAQMLLLYQQQSIATQRRREPRVCTWEIKENPAKLYEERQKRWPDTTLNPLKKRYPFFIDIFIDMIWGYSLFAA